MLGLALCATPGLAGHASSGPLVPIAIAADTLHVSGVGIWLGGLVMLFAALMPRADEPTLREVVPRYSQYALVAMGVIVVTGVFQAFRQIDRFGALLDTDYGRLLLIKVVVFLGLMVVAAVSRDVVNRRWRIPEDVLDAPVPVGVAGAAATCRCGRRSGGGTTTDARRPRWRRRRRLASDADDEDEATPRATSSTSRPRSAACAASLLIEVVISVVILAVTALLVNAAPARDLDTGPYLATLRTEQVSFDVTVTPANRGANEMHLFTLDPNGGTRRPDRGQSPR